MQPCETGCSRARGKPGGRPCPLPHGSPAATRVLRTSHASCSLTGVESASELRILGIPEWEMLMAELDDPAGKVQLRPNPTGPNPNEKLVKIFDSETETEALVVKGLLDSANIENSLGPVSLTQYAFPDVGGTAILVKEEDAEAARQLIEDYRRPDSAADDEHADIKINPGDRGGAGNT